MEEDKKTWVVIIFAELLNLEENIKIQTPQFINKEIRAQRGWPAQGHSLLRSRRKSVSRSNSTREEVPETEWNV